jgi:hypothetical protein
MLYDNVVDAAVCVHVVGLSTTALAFVEVQVEVRVVGRTTHTSAAGLVEVRFGKRTVGQSSIDPLLVCVVFVVGRHVGADEVGSLRTSDVESQALSANLVVVESSLTVLGVGVTQFVYRIEGIPLRADINSAGFA